MSNRQSFTPQVQDSYGQSDSKHIDEESRHYLPSNSRENQSEDDRESTDDGLDLFTDHPSSPLNITSVAMFVMYDIWVGGFLLTEIISTAKLLLIVHFFVLKHDKQTLSYVNKKSEGDRNSSFFFLQFILWEYPFFCTNTENYLGLRG